MGIAIISDIHGNMTALEAVLADLQTRHVEATYCLGDLVGYAAHPNEVTERIRAAGIPTIAGNYDDGVGFERDECGCAYYDVAVEASAIRASDLPDKFAVDIETGGAVVETPA